MANAMVDFLASLLGHVRGGLSYVLLGGDVSRLRHLRLQGRGHGGGGAGAVPRNEGARSERRANWSRCSPRPARMTETIPPLDRADHHRLGDGRFHRRRSSPAACCRRSCWRCALGLSSFGGAAGTRFRPASAGAPAAVIWRSFVVALPALALPFVIRAAVVEGRRDRDRGFDDWHRLCVHRRRARLSPVGLAPARADA